MSSISTEMFEIVDINYETFFVFASYNRGKYCFLAS